MTPTDSTPMTASASVPRRITDRQPSGTPIRSAVASAATPRTSVFGKRLHDQRRDRTVRPDVEAEIAGQRVAEELDDLPPHRLVESHALDQQPLQLRRGARPERHARRVARDEEYRRIHGDHDEDEDQETETDALDGVGEHGLRSLLQAKSRLMRRVAAALWTSLPRSRASSRQLSVKWVSSAVSSVRARLSVSASPLADRPTVLRHEPGRKRIVGTDRASCRHWTRRR